MWRYICLVLVLLGTGVFSPASAQEAPGTFRSARCMFDVPQNMVEGQTLECGYVTVPLRHREPDGPTIELAVAIVKSSSDTPQPDPFLMLQGGPGGSTIDTYIQYLALGRLSDILRDRDIILFDQRGTLYSKPALICPETLDLTHRTIEQRLKRDEAQRLSQEAMDTCHARLASEGIDLAAFNSLENAADVDAVRAALGYEQINLYGVSYGTLLALHTMRDFPQGLRSVILDAVVPTQTNFIPAVAQSQNRAFSELFAACEADPGCRADYPDLERVLFDLVDKLNAEPARIPMTDSATGKTYQAVFDGEALEGAIFQMLYASEIVPALPHAIYRLRDGDPTLFARVMPQIYFDRTFASGMYQSVICAEDADYSVNDVNLEGVRPDLAQYAKQDAESFLQACRLWDVPELDAPLDRPVTSAIPTLVLNGRFDPITPPANGVAAAETLSRSYVYTFNDVGHGAATTGACPASIISAFLKNPNQAPPSTCIDDQPAPEIISSRTVKFAPGLARALAGLDSGNLLGLVTPIICLVGLLSLFLVWPLIWLVRLLQNKRQSQPLGGRVAQSVAILAALFGVLFVVGAIAMVFQVAQQGKDVILLFGVPASWGWLMFLPWLMLGLAIAMLLACVLLWVRRFWSLPERLYYSLLTLAALVMSGGFVLLT